MMPNLLGCTWGFLLMCVDFVRITDHVRLSLLLHKGAVRRWNEQIVVPQVSAQEGGGVISYSLGILLP